MKTTILAVTLALMGAACSGSSGAGKQGSLPANQPDPAAEQPVAAAPAPFSLEIPAQPQEAPGALFAVAGVAEPQAQLQALANFAGEIGSMAPQMATPEILDEGLGEVLGAPVAGLDYGKPMWFLAVDPARAASPLVVVAAVNDADALARARGGAPVVVHQGYAALGSEQALRLVAPYALSTLIRQPPPAAATGTIEMARIWDIYGAQMEMVKAMALGQVQQNNPQQAEAIGSVISSIISFLAQTAILEGSLSFDAGASADVVLTPRPGSGLAQSLGGLPRSEFALAAPLSSGQVLIAGNLNPALLPSGVGQAVEASAKEQLGAAGGAFATALERWLAAGSGEFAAAVGVEKQSGWLESVWAVTDAAAAAKLDREVLDALGKLPADEVTLTVKPKAFRHGKVAVDQVTIRPGKNASKEERAQFEKEYGRQGLILLVTSFQDRRVVVLGPSAANRMKAIIDRTTGKKKPVGATAPMAAALEAARGRGDSVVAIVDLAQLAAHANGEAAQPIEPLVFGLGFGASIRVHAELPAAQVRALAEGGDRAATAPPPPPAP